MKCIICHEKEATVIDRNDYPFAKKKKLCADCHTERLQNDMIDILIVEKNSRQKFGGE